MTNRCPKCDSDRFVSDPKKGILKLVFTDKDGKDVSSPTEDGMTFVVCAWCSNKMLFVDPTKDKGAVAAPSLH